MSRTVTQITVVGAITGEVTRKTVKDKALAEFYVEDCGLRISAWEKRAEDVPEEGIVVVTGYLSTRSYEYEGKQRQSTDIRAMTITTIDAEEGPAF